MFLNFFNIIVFAPLFFSMGKTFLYFLLHIGFAFLLWITDYILILFFKNPVLIAVNSTIINIVLILTFVYVASIILKINFLSFFPISLLGRLIFHSSVIIVLVKFVQIYLLYSYPEFLQLIITAGLFGILLLLTGRFFKVHYIAVLKPVLFRQNLSQDGN